MLKRPQINIFWFRRDLRLNDNHGLFAALESGLPVLCIFVFDRNILSRLENKADRRVSFIYHQVKLLKQQLEEVGSTLVTFYGTPKVVFTNMIAEWHVKAVFANEDYEPEAIKRDEQIAELLAEKDISTHFFKDQVIFSGPEIVKPNGEPYTIFTPYKNRWLIAAESDSKVFKPFPSEQLKANFLRVDPMHLVKLDETGFIEVDPNVKSINDDPETLKQYHEKRDKLYIDGTSHAGVHLRFGTASIRELASQAYRYSETFLSELIWRDFFQSILSHFPKVASGASFKPAYENIQWRNSEEEFEKWCMGKTGYPVVDAGMRELYQTGFMHNRARMITASFLCKHLLIDWRWGEAWFAELLLDFDLAANNGGWQWAAGSGCDAAPYFRIFNPYTQQKKFDPDFLYVKKWVPEFGTDVYPEPLVEHEFARKRCLVVYRKGLQQA